MPRYFPILQIFYKPSHHNIAFWSIFDPIKTYFGIVYFRTEWKDRSEVPASNLRLRAVTKALPNFRRPRSPSSNEPENTTRPLPASSEARQTRTCFTSSIRIVRSVSLKMKDNFIDKSLSCIDKSLSSVSLMKVSSISLIIVESLFNCKNFNFSCAYK
jgi:hypothetical protein